jgi:Cys-rich four helix bundle protein (predicted Tat secretion target)
MERRTFIFRSIFASAAAFILPKWTFANSGATDLSSPVSYKSSEVLEKIGLIQASMQDCLKKGKVCAKHCEDLISAGDARFQKCLFTVQQMSVMCEATGKLAGLKSPLMSQILDSCIASLETCRDACLEHKDHFVHGMHLECKACAEACVACLDACRSLKKSLST